MYTPKISEDLIPVLYRLAKGRRVPMTKLVDGIIRKAVNSILPDSRPAESCVSSPKPRNAAA